jgi:hypothetical protein
MPYCIHDVQFAFFPAEDAVENALARFAITPTAIREALLAFQCPVEATTPGGYQQYLAHHLEGYVETILLNGPGIKRASPNYSSNLGEKADLAVSGSGGGSLFVEIEFRPNVEKDLAKFQIGYHSGRLAIGILILAISRGRLNAGYTTMPEFGKFSRVIPEFKPQHPLLLVGIDGQHVPSTT